MKRTIQLGQWKYLFYIDLGRNDWFAWIPDVLILTNDYQSRILGMYDLLIALAIQWLWWDFEIDIYMALVPGREEA